MLNLQNLSTMNTAIEAIVSGEQLNQDTVTCGPRVIVHQHDALHVIKELLCRNGKGIFCTLLYIDKQGNVCPKLQPQDWGRIAEFCQENSYLENTKMLIGWGKRKKVKRFTRSFLMVSIENMNGLGFLYTAPQYNAEGNLIVPAKYKAIYRSISSDGKDRFWMRVNRRKKDGTVAAFMVAITDPFEQLMPFDAWKDMVAKEGYYIYDGTWGSCSPGELKGHTVRLPGQYIGPNKDREVDWAAFYHEVTSGAWTEWCKNGGSADWATIAEFNSRCTLSNAYHKKFDALPIRTYALLADKFCGADGYEANDGLTFLRASYLAMAATAATAESNGKYEFTESAVQGLMLQNRPFNVNKVTSLSVSDNVMRILVKKYKPVFFYGPDMTEEQVSAFCAVADKARRKNAALTTCDINGEQVNLKGKLILIFWDEEIFAAAQKGEEVLPDFLTDLNGQKTYFYPNEFQSGLNILAIAHPDNGKAVLSTQVLTSYAANNWDKTERMVDILGSLEIDKIKEKLFAKEGKAPSWCDFQPRTTVEQNEETSEEETVEISPNYTDIINSVAPSFTLEQIATAWRRRVDQELKRLSKMFQSLNLPVEGTHTTIIPDLAKMLLDVAVLGVNEEGVHEIYSARDNAATINGDEYIDKALKMMDADISDKDVEAFINTVKTLSPGISVVPANDTTARANEGWDFDGDSMYAFKMDKGYKEVTPEHFEVVEKNATDRITLGHINRYPKTHPYGYMKCLNNTWITNPYGIHIEE